MKNSTMIFREDKSAILLVFAPIFAILSGILIAYNPENVYYILGILSLGSYFVLCFSKPFVAFSILLATALTVILSSIQLFGYFSILVVLGGIFVSVWILQLSKNRISIKYPERFWPILGIFFTLCLTITINWEGPENLVNSFTYIQLLLLFILVVNFVRSPTQLEITGNIIIFTSMFTGLIVILNHASVLPEFFFVESVESTIWVSGDLEYFNRATGFFGDPNFTALQILIGLPFIFEFWGNDNWRYKVSLFLAAIVILLAIIYTYSMGGLLGLIIIIILEGIFAYNKKNIKMLFQLLLIGLIGWWLIYNILPKIYLYRIQENLALIKNLYITKDIFSFNQIGTQRGDAWIAALKTISNSPIWGHSPGKTGYLNALNSFRNIDQLSLSAHNFLLDITSEMGLLGLFFFASLLIIAFWKTWPAREKSPSMKRAVFIALVATCIQGLGLTIQNQKALWLLVSLAFCFTTIPTLDGVMNEHFNAGK